METPALSVIVPVYRQWEMLPLLLADLAAQEGAPPFEVIIVDNEPDTPGPRPGAPDTPARHATRPATRFALRHIDCATPGSYAARNAGAAVARGGIFVFTDADCRPAPSWLAALMAAGAAEPEALLAGPVEVVGGETPNACEIYDMIRGIPQARYVARGYAATANLAVPAAVFAALGGFDPRRFSGGDAEFLPPRRRRGAIRSASSGRRSRGIRRAPTGANSRRRRGGSRAGRSGAVPCPAGSPGSCAHRCRPCATPAPISRGAPWRWRRTAVALRFRLWGVELAEMLRLLAGGAPER